MFPEFEYSEYLYGLLLLPLLAIVYFIIRKNRKRLLERFGNSKYSNLLYPDASNLKPLIKFVALMSALFLIIVGIANPRIGVEEIEIKREGVDIIIALDISFSMLAEDIKPNRLERAKFAINKLIDNLKGDRIGMIIFAGQANVLFPITSDYSAAKMFLSTIEPSFVGMQGTDIGAALDIAVNQFKTDDEKKRAIIIISDGEDHEEKALQLSKKAASQGFVIHTIGVGSPQGAPIPLYEHGKQRGFLRDRSGDIVISKMNSDMLQSIAMAGNGSFTRFFESEPDLQKLIDSIAKMEKTEFEEKKYSEYISHYQYFLFAAIILLIAELLFAERKGKLNKSIKKFVEDTNE